MIFVCFWSKQKFIYYDNREEGEEKNAFPSSQKQNFSLSYLLAAGRAGGGEEILNSGKCWELGQSRHNPGLGRGEH